MTGESLLTEAAQDFAIIQPRDEHAIARDGDGCGCVCPDSAADCRIEFVVVGSLVVAGLGRAFRGKPSDADSPVHQFSTVLVLD
jgi:hypothetical protein